MEMDINFVLNLILTGGMAYISWSLKELWANQKKDKERMLQDQEKTDKAVETVAENLIKHKLDLPKHYVLKEDFNREINKLDHKMDRVRDDIQDLSKNVSGLIAVIQERGRE